MSSSLLCPSVPAPPPSPLPFLACPSPLTFLAYPSTFISLLRLTLTLCPSLLSVSPSLLTFAPSPSPLSSLSPFVLVPLSSSSHLHLPLVSISHSSQVPCVDEMGMAKQGVKAGGESSMKLEWPTASLPSYVAGQLHHSPKMVILLELIFRSVKIGEKILVFR